MNQMSNPTASATHPQFAIDGGLVTITFNRPERANAWLPEQTAKILTFLHDVERRSDVRCVLFKANGRHFMAGGELNLSSVSSPAEHTRIIENAILDFAHLLRVLQRMPQPVVASVQGAVVGAAVGFVAACDLCIAADDAFFSIAHIHHGGSNDGLVSYFLPRIVGVKKALELALLGERFTAEQARDLSIVNFVVPAAELGAETAKLVTRLSAGPTRGYGLIKGLTYASLGNSMEEQARLEAEFYAGVAIHTEDVKEGLTAFLEKRPPRFHGR
jgi:2-(1,2-epoxy-1,2-dihydrophenyl)acetyl-CoA isomerase